jgi:hypothetical protein
MGGLGSQAWLGIGQGVGRVQAIRYNTLSGFAENILVKVWDLAGSHY